VAEWWAVWSGVFFSFLFFRAAVDVVVDEHMNLDLSGTCEESVELQLYKFTIYETNSSSNRIESNRSHHHDTNTISRRTNCIELN